MSRSLMLKKNDAVNGYCIKNTKETIAGRGFLCVGKYRPDIVSQYIGIPVYYCTTISGAKNLST